LCRRKSDADEENANVTAPEPDNVEHNSAHKEEAGNARKSKLHTGKKAHKHHRKKKHHRSGSGERVSKEPPADAAEKQPESGSADELLKSSEHDNHKHHHDRKKVLRGGLKIKDQFLLMVGILVEFQLFSG
jgi:hypothetical protein